MGANRASVGRVAVGLGMLLIAMSGSPASAAPGDEGILMPAGAITRSSGVIGARVRLTAAPNRRIVGVVTGLDRTTLTILTDRRSEVVTLLLSAITGVERSVGRGPRRPGKGFLAGAGTGAAVGFLIGSTSRCPGILAPPGSPANQRCFLEPWGSTMAYGLLGGGGGALIGAFSRPDRWAETPVTWLEGK